MSGAKRKGGYRKGVVDDYLNSYPEPEENEYIALVCGSRGSNIFEITLSLVAASAYPSASLPASQSKALESEPSSSSSSSSSSLKPIVELAIMPTKFKNVIWVKRGDFVIVSSGDKESVSVEGGVVGVGGGGGVPSSSAKKGKADKVKFFIKCILNKDQIKHLKAIKKWPQQISSDSNNDSTGASSTSLGYNDVIESGYDDEV